ncbi:hypothetical protein Syun_003686 [Stephania yunnanensis]|uniref:Uncharacterized protein n=1 Tax=Stephania yunnanensis TaxID=152371 RepID=A0AAP0L424_9MAGN
MLNLESNCLRLYSRVRELLASEVSCKPDDICDFELQACDTQPSVLGGAMKEFIFSGRLHNLCISFNNVQGPQLRKGGKAKEGVRVKIRMKTWPTIPIYLDVSGAMHRMLPS